MRQINDMSKFWMGNDVNDRFYDPITGVVKKPAGKDIFALIGYQRAIGNFVRIVTGDNIPVRFSGTDSYTDGKTVNISAGINNGNFDVAVGLALHEGSHIKLTNFGILKRGIDSYIAQTLYDLGQKKGVNNYAMNDLVKNMLNVVEDRRIDKYIQTEAPGYRGYYEAMYGYYFNDKVIDKALKSHAWKEVELENYMNHIINFINPNRTLDLLPGLRKIWNILDMKNISRLKDTEQALNVSMEMVTELITNLPDQGTEGTEGTEGTGGSEGSEGSEGTEGTEGTEENKGTEESEGSEGTDGAGNDDQLTTEQRITNKITFLDQCMKAPNCTESDKTRLTAYKDKFTKMLDTDLS